jgi:DNA helicase-2/ATP-dependent DNA helicase PcrA
MEVLDNNCRLVIAGPGAGKTYDMLEEVLRKIPQLHPHRFIAVVTYTNAATEEIRSRLQSKTNIPPNLFIGTTHSFLNRFIFAPYSRLFANTPFDTLFIDNITLPYRCQNVIRERSAKIKRADTLLLNGVVCHDKTVEVSHKLIQEPKIRALVARRLQFVFVDEYQDATILQHEIFMSIHRENVTEFYFIGDPEQYIFSFRYGRSLIRREKKPTCFEDIPIMQLKEIIKPDGTKSKEENKRSNISIVRFLNNFNTQLKQECKTSYLENNKVKFIDSQDLTKIIKCYMDLCEKTNFENKNYKKFFLSFANDTFESVVLEFSLGPVSNDSLKATTRLLSESINLITASSGANRKKLCDQLAFDEMNLRKLGIKVLKKLTMEYQLAEDQMVNFISQLGILVSGECNISNSYSKFRSAIATKGTDHANQYSTIHKAKGLDADAVLVIAEDYRKLLKWFETSYDRRFADKLDQCRIGFVGFSRAKELLCIACLEDIGDFKERLKEFDVEIIE